MAFLPGTRAFENSVAVESWLLVNTEFPSVNIVTSFMNIKQTLYEVPFSIKNNKKTQFENVTAFILTTVYGPYLRWCILNAYSFFRDSDLNSDWNTNEQRRNIFIHIFVSQRSIAH